MRSRLRHIGVVRHASTLAWSVKDEDRMLVRDDLLAIVDGAGSPKPCLVGGLSGGAWIAETLVRRFASLAVSEAVDLRTLLLGINEEIRAELIANDVDPTDKASVPAASLVAARVDSGGETMTLVQVGDCEAFVATAGGGIVRLFDPQQEPFDRRRQAVVDGAVRSGKSAGAVERIESRLAVEDRSLMNVPGGYGTIAGDPGVVEFVATATIELGALLLASDGLLGILPDAIAYDAVEKALTGYGLTPVASALAAQIEDRGGEDDVSVVLFGPGFPA